ncbi:hypothetical protein LTR78_008773 [Recurvomyces mirabilis]|uniref:Heterokaryon incompatibility domain-containing protein n=2 Tax=Recurvomyces mirabilis TaxID=574656 RepID=A0AAE0TPE7_9PEZI|nr:hypothetical protein LTR78_008773 [Recurvomyces mirabilis]
MPSVAPDNASSTCRRCRVCVAASSAAMMSVRERMRAYENTSRKFGRNEEREERPALPQRPSARPDAAKKDSISFAIQDKQRPIIPPKAKSLSGKLVTLPRSNALGRHELDRDANEPLITLSDNTNDGNEHECRPSLPARKSTSRLLTEDASIDGAGSRPPLVFRTLTGGLQQAASFVQREVPKAARSATNGAQNTLDQIQRQTPGVFQQAGQNISKAFEEVHSGITKVVNDIPVPKAFTQTAEDLSDLSRLQLGKPGLCSRCAMLDLTSCFTSNADNTKDPYVCWTSPLSRVALHYPWCVICRLLVSMLSRTENDPLSAGNIRQHIEQEHLRNLPFRDWISQGHIHQDASWPFGKSEDRHEGATQVVGPASEYLLGVAKRTRHVGYKVLIRSAAGRPIVLQRKDLRQTGAQRYRAGVERGREKSRQFPASATIIITVSKSGAEKPGLMWVDLFASSNKLGAEQEVVSHFMLRAVKNGISVHNNPEVGLSYGHVLDKHWIDVEMAKLWLKTCEMHHSPHCSEHGWALALDKPRFLRVIDVERLQVLRVPDPRECRFVALSYVWGGAGMLKLRYTNLEELSRPFGLRGYLDSLPRTILSAMQVVKAMGERYLWVDALCILQEPCTESQAQIDQMDSVYGSALCTITAAAGTHADAGFAGVRIEVSGSGVDSRSNSSRQVVQLTAPAKNNITIIAPSQPETTQPLPPGTSTWQARAWTFQEKLLSRRLLFFSDNEMTWHCRGMIAKEDMLAQDCGYETPELDWLALKPQHLGVGVDTHWKDGSFEITRHGRTHLVRSATFSEYARVVAQYTQRSMSYESDAVNALAGLLRIFSKAFESPCLYGLPTVLLDVALMWRPVESVTRRDAQLGFPSWSWAGWRGRVKYADLISIRRDEAGQFISIEGVRPLLRYFVFDAHVSNRHLIFWASWSDRYHLSAVGEELNILDAEQHVVGVAALDSHEDRSISIGMNKIQVFVVNEAHSSSLAPGSSDDAFPAYTVMLVETDARTGVSNRKGLGWVSKAAWLAGQCEDKLIYLG